MTERKKVRLPYGAKKYDIPESKKYFYIELKSTTFADRAKK